MKCKEYGVQDVHGFSEQVRFCSRRLWDQIPETYWLFCYQWRVIVMTHDSTLQHKSGQCFKHNNKPDRICSDLFIRHVSVNAGVWECQMFRSEDRSNKALCIHTECSLFMFPMIYSSLSLVAYVTDRAGHLYKQNTLSSTVSQETVLKLFSGIFSFT